jgi:hypothetical protein
LAELDAANLLEEIESMGRSEKQALESSLKLLLMHLLKYRYPPNLRSNSWRFTIRNFCLKQLKTSSSSHGIDSKRGTILQQRFLAELHHEVVQGIHFNQKRIVTVG